MEMRVQKILAEMGMASRRKAEEMIEEGRVTVNGKVAVLGSKADPATDHIKVDGKLITRAEPKVYFMFNKPVNVVTSLSDPEGRPTIKDFIDRVKYRVYPVGRLDFDSEGLLLITNDGDLAHAVMHPSKKVPKTYLVKVKGIIEDDALARLRRGVRIEGGMTAPAKVKKVRKLDKNSWVEVIIHEGRKRQVRRMLDSVGHPVVRLIRIGIDGLELGGLMPGQYRPLTPEELKRIKKDTGLLKEA